MNFKNKIILIVCILLAIIIIGLSKYLIYYNKQYIFLVSYSPASPIEESYNYQYKIDLKKKTIRKITSTYWINKKTSEKEEKKVLDENEINEVKEILEDAKKYNSNFDSQKNFFPTEYYYFNGEELNNTAIPTDNDIVQRFKNIVE